MKYIDIIVGVIVLTLALFVGGIIYIVIMSIREGVK